MRRLVVYEAAVQKQHNLGARTAIAAGTIREMPGLLHTVQHNIARRGRRDNEVGGRSFEQLL
jgi:hypothetical protein